MIRRSSLQRRRWAAGLAMAVLLALPAHGPAFAQKSAEQSGGALWPDAPKRVTGQNQSLERLPAKPSPSEEVNPERYPLQLKRTLPYRIFDSVSFEQEGKKYRLAGLEPIPVSKTCKNPDGARWACGLKSRVALNTLLRNKPIRCAPLGDRDGFMLVECVRVQKDVGAALVTAGYALVPKGEPRYRAELDEARREKSGVWAEAQAPGQ